MPLDGLTLVDSCWAFSTTGSVEGAYQIANKELLSLSEEDLVQCAPPSAEGRTPLRIASLHALSVMRTACRRRSLRLGATTMATMVATAA